MARRAKVVAPPPQDYTPEPLVQEEPTVLETEDDIIVEESQWVDGNLSEEVGPTEEELEKERIAKERYDEIQRKKEEEARRLNALEEEAKRLIAVEEEKRLAEEENLRLLQERENLEQTKRNLEEENLRLQKIAEESTRQIDPAILVNEEIERLRKQNAELERQKDAALRSKEDQILKMRKQATQQKVTQLNILEERKPSLTSRIKEFFKKRRIKRATTIPKKSNYEQAIIHQAALVVPKMLDDIEVMHERLTILEELLAKLNQRKKNDP